MPRSTERWRPLLTKVGDLRLRLGQHHSLRKLNHWPQICIKRQRCRQLDKSSLRLATEINNKGHPDRCFNHLHLFIRLCHTITFGSTSHEQKTALLHNSEALSLLDKWIKWLTLQQRCLPDLLWPLRQDSTGLEAALSGLGGGNTKSSPLCKVTSINYSDTLTKVATCTILGLNDLFGILTSAERYHSEVVIEAATRRLRPCESTNECFQKCQTLPV